MDGDLVLLPSAPSADGLTAIQREYVDRIVYGEEPAEINACLNIPAALARRWDRLPAIQKAIDEGVQARLHLLNAQAMAKLAMQLDSDASQGWIAQGAARAIMEASKGAQQAERGQIVVQFAHDIPAPGSPPMLSAGADAGAVD